MPLDFGLPDYDLLATLQLIAASSSTGFCCGAWMMMVLLGTMYLLQAGQLEARDQ